MKIKKCKDCWNPRNHNLMYSRCKECQYKFENNKSKKIYTFKQSEKPINKTSKTNKNTPAIFTQKTKDEILERDKRCIISWKPIEEYHHIFYWANANRWSDRNNADQWVWLSANVHRIIHHPSPKETKLAKIYRARCIIYIKEVIRKL